MQQRLATAGIIVGAVMTLAGGLAPLLPQADVANQFSLMMEARSWKIRTALRQGGWQ